jgi:chaperone modulatory protein CbpM
MGQDILRGTLLDDRDELSVDEVCRVCSVSSDWVIELVDEGVLDPIGSERSRWRFRAECLGTVRTARRLQHDLDVNLAGVALALDLLQEIHDLRLRLGRYEDPDRN